MPSPDSPVDGVRLLPRPVVRGLDHLRHRGLSLRAVDDDRVARGDLPVDVRDDQPESRRLQAAGRRRLQWKMVQEEDDQNMQLIELSNQILELTKLIHARTQAPQSVKQ